jgi:hypothetical protein
MRAWQGVVLGQGDDLSGGGLLLQLVLALAERAQLIEHALGNVLAVTRMFAPNVSG